MPLRLRERQLSMRSSRSRFTFGTYRLRVDVCSLGRFARHAVLRTNDEPWDGMVMSQPVSI